MERKQQAVLLIDDEYIVLQAAKRLLEKKGFEVFLSTNDTHALEILEINKNKVGVILLDLSIPGMNVEETLSTLKRTEPAAKIILFSGQPRTHDLEPLFQKGAEGYIQKPFEIDDLIDQLNRILGRTKK